MRCLCGNDPIPHRVQHIHDRTPVATAGANGKIRIDDLPPPSPSHSCFCWCGKASTFINGAPLFLPSTLLSINTPQRHDWSGDHSIDSQDESTLRFNCRKRYAHRWVVTTMIEHRASVVASATYNLPLNRAGFYNVTIASSATSWLCRSKAECSRRVCWHRAWPLPPLLQIQYLSKPRTN